MKTYLTKKNLKNLKSNRSKRFKDFLFQNISVKQTILKNTFWLLLAEGIHRGLMFFLTILIARYLGSEGFGRFSFIFAFVSLFAIISDAGLSTLTTREIAKNKKLVRKFISNIAILKVLLGSVTFGLVILIGHFIGETVESRWLVYLFGIYIVINSFNEFFIGVFRAFEMMQYETISKIIQGLALLTLGASVIILNYSVYWIVISYIIASLITLVITLILVNKKITTFWAKIDLGFWKNLLRMSWPFAGAGLLSLINFNFDQVLLGVYNYMIELGNYVASYKIINLLILIISFFLISLFPVFSRIRNKNKLIDIIKKVYWLLIPFGVIVVFLVTLFSRQITMLIFGSGYSLSPVFLRILVWSFFLILLRLPAATVLSARGFQNKVFLILIFSAISNITLNVIFIPLYGAFVAPITTIVSESMNLMLTNFTMLKHFKRRDI